MKRKRAIIFFVLWIVLGITGTIFSAVKEISLELNSGISITPPPFADYQLVLLLGFVPLVLIPLLVASCYFAVREENKVIKTLSICFLIHHIIAVVAVLVQM